MFASPQRPAPPLTPPGLLRFPPSLPLSTHSLLYYMPPEGTLLLNNIHKAPKAVLPLLRQTVDAVSRASGDDLGCDDCPSKETCDRGVRAW